MKFKDIFKLIGTTTALVNPAVGGAILAINRMLPDTQQLHDNSTVDQLHSAFGTLKSTEQVALQDTDIELAEIKSHTDIQLGLAEVDKAGASTRPEIAIQMGWVIALVVVPLAWALLYAVATADSVMITAIASNYMIVLALIAAPVTIVTTYFGNRQNDKRMRHSAAAGQPIPEVVGLISKLFKK